MFLEISSGSAFAPVVGVEPIYLAPQVGLEPTTLRLTAEWLVAASHCKQKELGMQKADLARNWGDSGGTLRDTDQKSRSDLLTGISMCRRELAANGFRLLSNPHRHV